MRKLALAIALLLAAPAAMAIDADKRQYWGLLGGHASAEDAEFGLVTALYGYDLIPHVALEARIGTTVFKEEEEIAGETHKLGLDYFGSAFVRLNLLTDDIRPYVLLGGTYGKVVLTGPLISGSDEESDFSWGGGISLHSGNYGVQAEYVRYWDKHGVVLDGVNIGLIAHF